jgi:hypothetical protein
VTTGLVANVPLIALSLLFRRVLPTAPLSPQWAVVLAAAGALLDVVLVKKGRPRPWAVRSQVPQWWGHQFGPWWGSARYGLRLGFGPATLLNSWLWWAGVGILSFSPAKLSMGLGVFVFARTVTMFGMSWGIESGSAMAQRAKRLDGAANPVRLGVSFALLAAAGISFALKL